MASSQPRSELSECGFEEASCERSWNVRPSSPVPVCWGRVWEEWHVGWLLGDAGAAAALSSAAVLPLNAGHQLLLGVVICDGRLPLGLLVAAAWGSMGEKHGHGKQDVTFKLHISTGRLQWPWMEF